LNSSFPPLSKEEDGMYQAQEQRIGAGASSGGISQLRDPPPPQGHIYETLTGTSKLVEALNQELSALEQRISIVLRSAGPSSGQANTKSVETSQLAATIETVNARLSEQIEYVRSLNARVDL
jgi:hypothetical protein